MKTHHRVRGNAMKCSTLLSCLLVFALLVISCQPSAEQRYDMVILHGKIIDGTGNPWFSGDVGIRGNKIAAIGKLEGERAKVTLEAGGKIVSPGFIDMLGQSELTLLVDNRAMSKISQGITTEVTGEGSSIAPLNEKILADMRPTLEKYDLKIDWRDLDGYFRRLEQSKSAINVGTFVGATQVRKYIIGLEDRQPSADELEEMKKLVRAAMEQGALGLSTSLIYAPATFAKTAELIELAKVAAEYGGIYASHIRDEGDKEIEAIYEAADIARAANLPVEIWHLKVAGKANWGKMQSIVGLIDQHRRDGIDISADVYPYAASSTRLNSRIPSWAHDGGINKLLERLKDPATRMRIRSEIAAAGRGSDNSLGSTGPEGILITTVSNPELKQYEGKRLSEIAAQWNKDPVEMMMDLLVADSARTSAIFFSMNEQDVKMAMAQPWVSFCTDGGQRALDGPLFEGKPHPRSYGSFARVLGKYVREENIITLEDAIRKMTSLPAARVGLKERGILKPGFYADVVIFDPKKVSDKATFENPHQYSEGIDVVIVNGRPVWEEGKFTGNLPGMSLRGPGYRGR